MSGYSDPVYNRKNIDVLKQNITVNSLVIGTIPSTFLENSLNTEHMCTHLYMYNLHSDSHNCIISVHFIYVYSLAVICN
jgi:hypothetical protein